MISECACVSVLTVTKRLSGQLRNQRSWRRSEPGEAHGVTANWEGDFFLIDFAQENRAGIRLAPKNRFERSRSALRFFDTRRAPASNLHPPSLSTRGGGDFAVSLRTPPPPFLPSREIALKLSSPCCHSLIKSCRVLAP